MPAIGDKVWYRKDGKSWRGDVCRVVDATTVDINVHGSMTQQGLEHHELPEDGHAMVLFGVSEAKAGAPDKPVDGTWWPRGGSWTTLGPGRKQWNGE